MLKNLMTHFLGLKNLRYRTYSESTGLYMKLKQVPLIEKYLAMFYKYLFNNTVCQLSIKIF